MNILISLQLLSDLPSDITHEPFVQIAICFRSMTLFFRNDVSSFLLFSFSIFFLFFGWGWRWVCLCSGAVILCQCLSAYSLPSAQPPPSSDITASSRGRDSRWRWWRRSVHTQNGMDFEALFSLSEYFGTVFHSYEGILLPGPHSLTFPPTIRLWTLLCFCDHWTETSWVSALIPYVH